MRRKVLDGSRIRAAGWSPATSFREGIELTYRWMCNPEEIVRGWQ
jgi:nucleoside-diphosphate-sugar epimerase